MMHDPEGFQPKPGKMYVYVIDAHDTPYVKIGASSNPVKRWNVIKNLIPHESHLAVVYEPPEGVNALHVESWLCGVLAHSRARGEWFALPHEYVADMFSTCECNILSNQKLGYTWHVGKKEFVKDE